MVFLSNCYLAISEVRPCLQPLIYFGVYYEEHEFRISSDDEHELVLWWCGKIAKDVKNSSWNYALLNVSTFIVGGEFLTQLHR